MIEFLRAAGVVVFVSLGLFFTLVSTVGVLRLPDVYSRAHTASQADTLGAGFALAGVALGLGWTSTALVTVLLLFFIFITNPTAAHAITRAAHEEGIEPWTTDDDRTDADLLDAAEHLSLRSDGGPTRPSGGPPGASGGPPGASREATGASREPTRASGEATGASRDPTGASATDSGQASGSDAPPDRGEET